MTVPVTVGVACDACVQHGILISKVQPLFHAATVLKPFDVLTAISGVPIADDGTIQFRNSMSLLGATAHDVSHYMCAPYSVLWYQINASPSATSFPCSTRARSAS